MTNTQHHADVLPLPTHLPAAPSVTSVQGSLALDLTPRLEPPRPPLRATRAQDLVLAQRADRRRIDAFVGRFLQAASEIAVGDRPVSQVLRHCSPEIREDLAQRALQVSRAAGTTLQHGRGPAAVRPVVASVRTSLVRMDALEACCHVRHGRRSRAMAARFEFVGERWQCVALEWG